MPATTSASHSSENTLPDEAILRKQQTYLSKATHHKQHVKGGKWGRGGMGWGGVSLLVDVTIGVRGGHNASWPGEFLTQVYLPFINS